MDFQILIVEDDPASQELLTRNLQKIENVHVAAISDGKDALKRLESDPPHMVVLDVNLPGMSGIDLIKHIRQRLNLNAMKVVMLTANTVAAQSSTAKLADAILEKPVSNHFLRRKCSELLNALDFEQHQQECEDRVQRHAIDEVFSERD